MPVYVTRYPDLLGRRDLSAGAKLVWFYLADRQGDADVCWPSVERIAADCGLSDRATRSILKTLADKGLIERVTDRRKRDARGRERRQYAYRVHGLDAPKRRKRRPAKTSGRAEQQAIDFPTESESANPSYPDRSVPSGLESTQGSGSNSPGSNGKRPRDDRQKVPVTESRHRQKLPSSTGKNFRLSPQTPNYEPPSVNHPDGLRAREAAEPEGGSNGERDPMDLSPQERTGYTALIRGYANRFEHRRQAPAGDQRGHMAKLARIFVAPMAEREQREPAKVAHDLLDGVFANPWLSERDWPLGAVVSQPARYYRPPTAVDPEQSAADVQRRIRKLRAERRAALDADDVAKAEEVEREIDRIQGANPACAGDGGQRRR